MKEAINTYIEEFIESLQKSTKAVDKKEVLEQYWNANVEEVMEYLLDSRVTSGMSLKALQSFDQDVEGVEVSDFLELIQYVKENNSGTHEVMATVKGFTNSETLLGVISKDIKIGVTAKTVNKLMDTDIFNFQVQRAYALKGKESLVQSGREYTLTEKLDGHRVVAMYEEGILKFFSRGGGYIEDLSQIKEDINSLEFADTYILDGEILLEDSIRGNLPSKEAFNKVSSILRSGGLKEGLKFHVFDIVPKDEFFNGGETEYSARREMLEELIPAKTLTHLTYVPALYVGNDTSFKEIKTLLEEAISQDKEGLMLNFNDAPYKASKNTGILKVKEFYDSDLEITGYFEGEGRLKGSLGGFIVDFKGVPVRVGSGYSDAQRKLFWGDKESYIGKLLQVQYARTTSNDRGEESLLFPTFIRIRDDKEEVSIEGGEG